MSDFMQHQVTGKQRWLKVETNQGTEFVSVYDTGLDLPGSDSLPDNTLGDSVSDLQQYCEGTIQSWENITGYGARLSAPGYLDCTEWTVFDTEDEAREYLEEMYPEDEEDSGE